MVLTNIDRTPTTAERNEMKMVGEKSPISFFSKILSVAEMKYVKKHKPFDTQCARIDFHDEIERVGRESERVYGYVREEDMNEVDIDLEKYGDEDRFEQIDDDEEIEFMNVNGIRTPTKAGHTIKYRCKKRGHGISVFLPMDVYDERFGVKEEKEGK